ncbi:hypothetical protein Tco_0073265 [Tanacetum coccineum]
MLVLPADPGLWSEVISRWESEEYEDYLRRSHEDFQPLPRIFTETIFTPEEPGALYKHTGASTYCINKKVIPKEALEPLLIVIDSHMDITSDHRPVSAGNMSITLDSVHAGGRVHSFVENLLGESEKLMWQQWRTVFPEAYSALEAIADEPQNITSQVRQLILLEDPYRGSTDEQDRAYRDLDRITCEETKNLWSFLEDFRQLATKSGRLYFPSTTEKLFAKLPLSISKNIEESFRTKYPGLNSGVLPAIKFTHTFVSEMCKDAALAKELRDLSLCSAIPIPEEEKDFNNNEVKLLKELLKEKTEQVQQMIRDQAKEYYENKAAIQKKEEIWQSKESLLVRDLTNDLKIIDQLRIEKKRLEEQKYKEIRELKTQLQKKKEEAEVQFSREEFP